MDTRDEFKQAFMQRIGEAKQPQLVWVVCTSVDWSNKLMDAKGVSDDLDYYDIELGAGALDCKPVVGATCLVGILEGNDTDAFMLFASEVERIEIKSTQLIEFNAGTLGGLVKVNDLVTKLNTLEQDLNNLKSAFSGWTPVPQDGGAALKAALASYMAATITKTKVSDIENNKIKQ